MGLFDFFKKKKGEQKTVVSSKPMQTQTPKPASPKPQQNSVTSNLFSKSELENLIKTLSKISYIFRDCDLLVGGRNQKMMSSTHSYAGILGYLYEVDYKYGKMKDIVDSQIASHYLLVMMSMSDASHKRSTINDLADNWSDVLQVIYNLQLEPNTAGDKLKAMDGDIKKITAAFEKLSGKKCKAPKNPLQQSDSEDKYTKMVKNATFNPFKITCDPRLQNSQPVPNIKSVLANELSNLYSKLSSDGQASKKNLVSMASGYAFNLVESYYNNAGYVPKNSLDQIIEQVYQAMQQTGFRSAFDTLDDFKYNCYYGYLNR